MDKEALQRQVEDLEQASERWRAERRRLNAEIDKLESALAEAKIAAARKRASAAEKADSVDPAAVAKIQEAAQEKLKTATDEWDAERGKLKAQINRLEGNLTEAIARASNPLRVTQSVKEQFELELTRVAKEKTDLEQAFLRAKTEWEQEKLKVTGEMVKLRRNAQIMGRPLPTATTPEVNPKVREIEKQLKEKVEQSSTERERLVAQIQKLEGSAREWDTERRQLNDHAGQLQQAFVKAQAKIDSYEVAARKPNPFQMQLEEMKREKEGMQREFQGERELWDDERRRLTSQAERAERQLQQKTKDSAPENDPKFRELQRQLDETQADSKAQAELHQAQIQKFEEAARQWDTERKQLGDRALSAQQALIAVQADLETYEIASRAPNPSEARVEALNRQIAEARNEWKEERGRLNSQIEQFQQQVQKLSDTNTSSEAMNQQLTEARNGWDEEKSRLSSQIEQLQQQLQKMSDTSVSSEATNQQLTEERTSLNSQVEQLQQQLQRVANTSDHISNEVVDQLRQQYEQKLQEAIQQKTQLAEELQNASARLEGERVRLGAAHKDSGGGFDAGALQAEVSRVERQINEIVEVIEDSETELSTIIRKNVEKAELDAYLKGILFALGRKEGEN